jgi:phosphatidylethanolamine-binding protein (PEBP) family uncharacterized protein
MEPRKGADGLIAPFAKAASARVALALAVAVLLALSGCGGGDDPETATTTGSAGAPSTETARTAKSSESSPAGKGGAAKRTSASTETGNAGSAGKKAPPIAVPEGAPEPGITPEQRENAKVASIALQSPAALSPPSGGPALLPAQYTCDGKDSWPELSWQGVPSGTEELVLFAMGLAPVKEKLFFAWALAGLDPELSGIEVARLPKGAVQGQNSEGKRGYSICPAPGQAETYFFALYALPERLSTQPGFDPRALRERVQESSRNVGILAVNYQREG